VNDGFNRILLEEAGQQLLIGNVTAKKKVLLIALQSLQVFKIAGIGERIKVDELIVRVGAAHVMDEI